MRIPALALAGLLTACQSGRPPVELTVDAAPELRGLVAPATAFRVAPFPGAHWNADALSGVQALVIGGEGWRPPDCTLGAEPRAALRAFVERGGRLLLLGYAASLAHGLGLEPECPDVQRPFRWGFDARTALGRARLGVQIVSGRMQELVEGMQPAVGREHVYWLAGGEPCCVPTCLWSSVGPARGEVLGRLAREIDGAGEDSGAVVLARWSLGRGAVLALGLQPDVGSGDAVLAGNARAFLQQAFRWLGDGAEPRTLGWWRLPDPAPAPAPLLPALDARAVPGAPLLAHWGWLAAVDDGAGARRPEGVLDEVLWPSWCAGADVLALDLVDGPRGLPLPWEPRDLLARPADYRGAAFTSGWNRDSIGALAAEAHARGMLAHALVEPLAVGGGAAPALATLRFLARELGDLRRLGPRSLDGFGVRTWFPDGRGLGAAMLHDFQPAARLLCAGEGGAAAGSIAALDAADGQPQGLRAYGISAAFRGAFPGDLFPAGILDATSQRPAAGGEGPAILAGGGSGGDWIAQQAADFVRDRRGRGGVMLWRAHDLATLGPDTVDYVQGVAMEPLLAAVAARCTTLGQDGWRAAQRALRAEVQAGFGAEVPVAAATVMLQNNHLRLFGSGGALLLDPQGLGRFRTGEPAVLAAELFRTRLFGGRPDAEELRSADLDLLAGGRRSSGGQGALAAVAPGGAVPEGLGFGGGRWPQRIDFTLDAGIGCFELELGLRALAGQGIVAVALDGERLLCLPFQDGRLAIDRALPLHLSRAGRRVLQLEVADGGEVALDRLRLRRRTDLAAEAHVGVPAGSFASLQEHSASTYHDETVTLCTLADFPGFLLQSECVRAARGLQLERRFGLRAHRTLRMAAPGEGPAGLRTPFVLGDAEGTLPDLAVVPLLLGRYERFELREGELVLVGKPEAGSKNAVGFCFLDRGRVAAVLPHLPAVFGALQCPTVLDLGDQGLAELHPELPVAWTRMLRLEHGPRTPFLVRENGWWTWQPGQLLADGAQLLRVRHLPGDVVQIVGGPALLARTRPGPGSLRTVALREPSPDAVLVRVLEHSPLAPPSVVMGAPFDEALVDGRPWAHHDGSTIWLPDKAGTYRVATRCHGGGPQPHVRATSAVLEHCAFDAERKELVLVASAPSGWPADLALTAVLGGPLPRTVDGGELVPEAELRHGSAADRAAAVRGGALIRFRPGVVRVRYGD